MKNLILVIIFLQIGSLDSYSQDSTSYEFIVNGLIGLKDVIPVTDAVVIINDQIKISNQNGKIDFRTNLKHIEVKVRHLDFSELDTIFNSDQLNQLTELLILSECIVNGELAKVNISDNKIELMLAGGIAPTLILGQEKIENKYNFKYYEYGCTSPPNECLIQYNYEMFKYLDNKYGNSWRDEVRNDVIGFSQYLNN